MKTKSLLFFLCCSITLHAQISVHIRSGVNDSELKQIIGNNAETILSEFQRANAENRNLVFDEKNVDADFIEAMNALWKNIHFEVKQSKIDANVISLKHGFLITDIAIHVIPQGDASSIQEEELNKTASLNFDKKGKIIDFTLTDDELVGKTIYENASELDDVEHWMEIKYFVDQYRTAYEKKDSAYIERIFSDDALIVVGKVIKPIKGSDINLNSDIITYKQYNKPEYLANLKSVFRKNSYLHVYFDDIKIYRHPNANKYPYIYGVLVTQRWYSPSYSDIGYVFMLWDFSGEEPLIRVRTWQPKYLDKDHIQQLDDEDIFDPSYFDLNKN